jgi:acetyl/propionyl-CoA carboxylase alpha subunit
MGIGTVAVFSAVDRHAPFVQEADEAVALGGALPSESYLSIDLLIDAAAETGADAIHPGYGFLAENAGFARAVIDAGLTWIGPSPEAMSAMGSKLESKRLVDGAGVLTLPSVDLTGLGADQVLDAARGMGYPVFVKASAGGGGKGMRIVAGPDELLDAVEGARREAGAAFGDDTVFLERHLIAPRHIEIQVFGDAHGNIVPMFERECSIQRRHQKIIEEAPSPVIDVATRDQMGAAAVAAARSVGYVGAGTVEFLYDGRQFFFLEMNTRLQVEHAVTEEITALDLVRLQLLVAQGEALPEDALNPAMVGHAIEARLYAEDPQHDFLPVAGRVERFEFSNLPGLRIDSGVESGSEVSPFYDPMIAKVVAWAETRREAATLLAEGLQRARIHGLITNRELLVRVLRHPEFLSGDIDTHFLERHSPADLGGSLPGETETRIGAVAAALAAQSERRAHQDLLGSIPSGWRNSPSQLHEVDFDLHGVVVKVGYRFEARGGVTIALDDETLEDVDLIGVTGDRVGLQVGAQLRWFDVARNGWVHHVDGPGGYVRLVERPRFPDAAREEDPGSLHAPMPGRIVKVMVGEGDDVIDGQVVIVLEAMKMEHSLRAPYDGMVRSVTAAPGDQVEAGTVLVVVEPRT